MDNNTAVEIGNDTHQQVESTQLQDGNVLNSLLSGNSNDQMQPEEAGIDLFSDSSYQELDEGALLGGLDACGYSQEPIKELQSQDSEEQEAPTQETVEKVDIDPVLLKSNPQLQVYKELVEAGLEKDQAASIAFQPQDQQQPQQPLAPKFQLDAQNLQVAHRLATKPTQEDINNYAQNTFGIANLSELLTRIDDENGDISKLLSGIVTRSCMNEHQALLSAYNQEQSMFNELRQKEEQYHQAYVQKFQTAFPELTDLNDARNQAIAKQFEIKLQDTFSKIGKSIAGNPQAIEKLYDKAIKEFQPIYKQLLDVYGLSTVNDGQQQAQSSVKSTQRQMSKFGTAQTTASKTTNKGFNFQNIDFEDNASVVDAVASCLDNLPFNE